MGYRDAGGRATLLRSKPRTYFTVVTDCSLSAAATQRQLSGGADAGEDTNAEASSLKFQALRTG